MACLDFSASAFTSSHHLSTFSLPVDDPESDELESEEPESDEFESDELESESGFSSLDFEVVVVLSAASSPPQPTRNAAGSISASATPRTRFICSHTFRSADAHRWAAAVLLLIG
jgi:hypothetical protein